MSRRLSIRYCKRCGKEGTRRTLTRSDYCPDCAAANVAEWNRWQVEQAQRRREELQAAAAQL